MSHPGGAWVRLTDSLVPTQNTRREAPAARALGSVVRGMGAESMMGRAETSAPRGTQRGAKQVVGREANAGEMENTTFWEALDRLVACHSIRIDRPRGTVQPSDPGLAYPMDYGYLEGTVSGDGEGIDVWIGSSGSRLVTGVLCTIDTYKADAEIKLLVGCAPDEAKRALETHNRGLQSAFLVERASQASQSPSSPRVSSSHSLLSPWGYGGTVAAHLEEVYRADQHQVGAPYGTGDASCHLAAGGVASSLGQPGRS